MFPIILTDGKIYCSDAIFHITVMVWWDHIRYIFVISCVLRGYKVQFLLLVSSSVTNWHNESTAFKTTSVLNYHSQCETFQFYSLWRNDEGCSLVMLILQMFACCDVPLEWWEQICRTHFMVSSTCLSSSAMQSNTSPVRYKIIKSACISLIMSWDIVTGIIC